MIVPVPWDVTTSYRAGTAGGPDAIRRASHQLDLYDRELGEFWRDGIAMLDLPAEVMALGAATRPDAERVIAVGGRIGDDPELAAALARVNAASARVDQYVHAAVDAQLRRGKLVGVLGGDHSVPLGAITRHAADNDEFGILRLDAHCDLRRAYEASSLARVDHVQRAGGGAAGDPAGPVRHPRTAARPGDTVAASDGRVIVHPTALAERGFHGESWAAICADIVAALPAKVYLSLDIDGLDPALCPSTGTPVPSGLARWPRPASWSRSRWRAPARPSSASICARWRRRPTATSGTPTSALACCTRCVARSSAAVADAIGAASAA
ncbi:MAG: arginase family protein [Kofleriaceae bacterium]